MIQSHRSFWLPAVFCVVFLAGRSDAGAQPSITEDVDAYVERVRAQFEVPGIAVAIVKDGKVVMARGYGVRKLGEPAKVDSKTLFAPCPPLHV